MSKTILTNGQPVDNNHKQIDERTGMQASYVVLTEAERAKGYVRPFRDSYVHTCGVETRMGFSIAETYAVNPKFYNGTFCVGCKQHYPLDQFHWTDTNEIVGS